MRIRLPDSLIRTDAVDAALAVLTVHHWTDLAAGVCEMLRIARRRVVIVTWEGTVFRNFFLTRRVQTRGRENCCAAGCLSPPADFTARTTVCTALVARIGASRKLPSSGATVAPPSAPAR